MFYNVFVKAFGLRQLCNNYYDPILMTFSCYSLILLDSFDKLLTLAISGQFSLGWP